MTVKLKGRLKGDTRQGLHPNMLKLMEISLDNSGLSENIVTLASGKRFGEEHHDIYELFPKHWNEKVSGRQTHTLASLARTANNPEITKLMKQLILRIKDVDKTDYGKHGWKQKQRPEIGKGMEPTKVQDPKIIYGSGAWTPGINEINVIIDGITGNRKLNTPAKKAALKAQIEKNIKAVRWVYGGHGSKHHQGVKGDFRYRELNPKTLAIWKALGLKLTHEPYKGIVDVDFSKIKDMTPAELKEKLNSRVFKNKVLAIMRTNSETGVADRDGRHTKSQIRHNAWYNQIGKDQKRQSSPAASAARTAPAGPTERLSGASGVASIRQLYNKARKASKSKKANAYADVVESLRAFEGEKPLYIKKLEEKFSDMTPRTGMGHYATYLDQGRSWKAPAKEKSEGYTGPDLQEVMKETEVVEDPRFGSEEEFKAFKADPSQTEGYTGIDDPSIMVEEEETEGYTGPDEQAIRHFDREEGGDQKTNTPRGYPDEPGVKLALEGSSIPLKNDDIEFKEKVKLEEQVPETEPTQPIMDIDVDVIDDYNMRTGSQSLRGAPLDVMEPQAKATPKYKTYNEGGSVLKEPELSEDEEIAARQTGDTDIVSEAVEDKVTGTVPTPVDAWRLKPKEPKPPVEASFDNQGNVILTKQQEVEDVSTKSDQELKDNLEETLEVKSDPNSDTITLSPRKSQVQRNKAYKAELDRRKKAADAAADAAVEAGRRETKSIMAKPEVKVDLKEKVDVEETGDPQVFDLQTYIQQTLQRDDDAREIMRNELSKANEAELNIQKVEPYRFWNTMSTPAKIVAGIGMLIGGYAAKDSPAGLQAVMNVIDGAVNADIQAQKLTQDQQLVVAKEATRRAKAAVDKYKAVATSPIQKAKLMELSQALEVKKAGVAKKQQLQALKTYVMNQARSGRLHLVPPSLMRMVYPKDDMKRIDTMRTNYEKERKDRKIQPVLSAYRRMHNLISRKEDVTGMDDIAIVFSFMKLLDPGSVVRESEFETAANAGPRAKWFARQWNRFITGGRFTQADRKGFLRSSLTLVKPAMDEDKELQRKYVSMARRYGYPAAFVIPPSTRYFDLPGTRDDAAIKKIMKEQGKTREEAEDIHHYVVHGVKSKRQLKREKPRYYSHKGVKYKAR